MTVLNCFFHLMMIFHFCSSFLFILFPYISVKSLALESHFDTVETAPDQCKRLFTDPKERPKSTLEVFNMYGPCSPTAGKNPKNMPSAQEILHHDRLRVESLQARFKHNSKTNKYDTRFKDTKEVTHIPVLRSNSLYAISVGLGTPQQIKTLAFDTGSDMTWVQGYNHDISTSFKSISCDSPFCNTSYIPYHTCNKFGDKENTCYYSAKYEDGVRFKGVFSKDILKITQTGEVFQNFLFGFSTESSNLVADGMLGLDKSQVSFVSQTSDIYKGMFSYCIPSSPSKIGFMKLGPRDYPNDDVKFTRFITSSNYDPSFYFIDITSIKVAGVELSIGKFDLIFPGTIIDSGTTYTYLPKNVYRAMRDKFRKKMRILGHLIVQSPIRKLDTCYYKSRDLVEDAPTITFIFQGGVSVDMDASATLVSVFDYQQKRRFACLAFAENINDDDLSVFGNHQQRRFEVVYDVYGEGLAFIPNKCP
ncbi:hypothetical protein CASFOL_026807 [Castilleja foliolosa]|uniref:Peptidase A1 domain-containing protein n=1 Tax=Castilleja foliolosa TaxID=1961234 RepID=A0ABD3CI43_9LAMI